MSKYKHVTWRCRTLPWQAQVNEKYLGSFADEELAAQAVAKKLRQPKASLLRATAPAAPRRTHEYVYAAPKRTHKYVYWHTARQKWQVKIGATHHDNFDNHEDALQKAIATTKRDRDSLQLHPDVVRKSLQGQHNAVAQQTSWFHDLYAAYSKPDEVAKSR